MNGTSKKYDLPEILQPACQAFGLDYQKADLIRYNSNLVYNCGKVVLRLTHSKDNAEDGIIGELTFMQFMAEKGLPVVKVVTTIDGYLTKRIDFESGYLTAVCFEKIKGHRVTDELWNGSHFEELGKLTGLLHKYGIEFQEKTNLPYKAWNEIAKGQVMGNLPDDERKLPELHQKLLKEFSTYPRNPSVYGLIHYDIHFGNYLFKDKSNQFLLFDFEMLCYSWFINDISVVLYYAFFRIGDDSIEDYQNYFLHHFWKGYEAKFSIIPSEKEKIPKFLLYRDLLVYSFLHRIWVGKELTKEDSQFKKRLEKSIKHRRQVLE